MQPENGFFRNDEHFLASVGARECVKNYLNVIVWEQIMENEFDYLSDRGVMDVI